MSKAKKIGVLIISFFLLLFLLNWGVNLWLNNKLPKIISQNNNSSYFITYKTLNISLWSSSIQASEVVVVPKTAIKDTVNKAGIYTTIASITVENFNVWDVLFNNKIKAKSIRINRPVIVLYKKNEKTISNSNRISNDVVAPFQKVIAVSEVYLTGGELKIIYLKNVKPILSASNINFQIEGIVTSDALLKNKIPVVFNNYQLTCDSVFYRINEFYSIKIDAIKTTKSALNISNLSLIPTLSRKQFVSKIATEKDLFAVRTKTISINKMDWGFANEKFYFKSDAIILDQLNATIYRNKIPADDLSKKPLYNKLLRDLKFNLAIDTLKIKNSKLEYAEEINYEKGPGILNFTNFNLIATNIKSGFERKKLQDLKININCMFMNTSHLKIDWKFNVLDKSEGFNIKGSVLNFNTKRITSFLKPNNNVSTEGILDKVYFNFSGNDLASTGDFSLKYHDLKVTVLKKNNPDKKNKLKSAIGNLFLKKDSGNGTKTVSVSVDRIPEKSFYNFLWRNIAEGLKKILI